MSQNFKDPEGKLAAIIGYFFFFVGTIIAVFINMEKRHDFARFHIRQSCGIHFIFVVLAPLVTAFNDPKITIALWIFYAVLWIYGFLNAVSGKTEPIPILGNFFQKIFKVL